MAHQVNLTSARIVLGPDRTVDVDVGLKGSDVDRAIGTHVFDPQTGLVRADALTKASGSVVAYVRAHAVVMVDGETTCRAGSASVAADQDGVAVRTRWFCADVPGRLRYRSTVLLDVAPDAKQVVLIGNGVSLGQDLLDARRTETSLIEIPRSPILLVIGRYLEAGIERILLGWDYSIFLIGITLWVRHAEPVIKIAVAYTGGFSITLPLATLTIIRVPTVIIQPVISASIIYVAVKNFSSFHPGRRWPEAFCFGLIHGFGFAAGLRALGLPDSALFPALASFAIGIVIGQLTIAALLVPALQGVDRILGARTRAMPDWARPSVAVYVISAVIMCLGGYWFLTQTVLPA